MVARIEAKAQRRKERKGLKSAQKKKKKGKLSSLTGNRTQVSRACRIVKFLTSGNHSH